MTSVSVISEMHFSFLLTCLLRGMTYPASYMANLNSVSTHMPLARHDRFEYRMVNEMTVSTHMPLARHDLNATEWFLEDSMFLLTCLLRGMTEKGIFLSHSPKFLLTCLLRGMTVFFRSFVNQQRVSTHMPLARHDPQRSHILFWLSVSTHMPLARHDYIRRYVINTVRVSTHMPLARHDASWRTWALWQWTFLLTCLLRGMT